jgi:hypothetical protein
MKNEDILSIVQELPLFISLKLKRLEQENSAVNSNNLDQNNSISDHLTPNNTNSDVNIFNLTYF